MRKLVAVAIVMLAACDSPVAPPEPVCVPSSSGAAVAEVVEDTPTHMTLRLVCYSNGVPEVRWRILEMDGTDVLSWTGW